LCVFINFFVRRYYKTVKYHLSSFCRRSCRLCFFISCCSCADFLFSYEWTNIESGNWNKKCWSMLKALKAIVILITFCIVLTDYLFVIMINFFIVMILFNLLWWTCWWSIFKCWGNYWLIVRSSSSGTLVLWVWGFWRWNIHYIMSYR
jgi:hypothetical protein